MADNPRQEIDLRFGGVTYRVRPDFRALVGIEGATGSSSRLLGIRIMTGQAGVSEIATVLELLLTDKGGPPREKIGEIIMADGHEDLWEPLGLFLTRAVKGHKFHEEQARKEAVKTTTDPPEDK